MKRRKLRNPIPRSVRACLCAVLAILLALAYYIAIGAPTLTFRQEFRRAEKANLVGPSQIVDILDKEYPEFDKLIVGETEYGICFFGRYFANSSQTSIFDEKMYFFNYLEKTGDLTIVPAPNIFGVFWEYPGETLPVYIFAEEPNAVRAEIEFTVTGQYTHYEPEVQYEASFKETFTGEAVRTDSGVFRFIFISSSEEESRALAQFSSAVSGNSIIPGQTGSAIPVTVRLYNAQNDLISEKNLIIGAEDAQAATQ